MLKRKLPDDVLGRLVDIVKVKSKKDNVAIAVLMGRQMDSVVVRSFAAAKECLKILKEERADPMEFIPLDHVQVRCLPVSPAGHSCVTCTAASLPLFGCLCSVRRQQRRAGCAGAQAERVDATPRRWHRPRRRPH